MSLVSGTVVPESRVSGDEPSIEVGKSEEGLHFLDVLGFRPLLDGLDFGRIHGNTFRRDKVS